MFSVVKWSCSNRYECSFLLGNESDTAWTRISGKFELGANVRQIGPARRLDQISIAMIFSLRAKLHCVEPTRQNISKFSMTYSINENEALEI